MTRRWIGATASSLAALLGVGIALGSCSAIDVSEPGPLTISLTAVPGTAVTGARIDFRFEASGERLSGIALFFGDGAVDSIDTALARTAAGTRSHTYTSAGTYLARITVLDDRNGQAADTVTVQVTPAAAGTAAPAGRQSRR